MIWMIYRINFVLSGYGGEDLNGFLSDLKKYKTIKVDGDEGGAVSTLNIEIPIEARNSVLMQLERQSSSRDKALTRSRRTLVISLVKR